MLFLTKEEELNIDVEFCALYFYASWFPYHKKMLVMIDKVENKYDNLDFLAIDVDAFPSLCKRFHVDSIPVVIIFNNGMEKKRINGTVLTSAFKSAFVDICNSDNL